MVRRVVDLRVIRLNVYRVDVLDLFINSSRISDGTFLFCPAHRKIVTCIG